MRYGVLVGVSTGYPPVAGRLHTRYAPVRRSPAAHCWAPLPLDLHVLSLPLAFILSQDQTLHCKNCLLSTFDSSRVSTARPLPGGLRHTLSHLPNCFNVLLPSGSLAFSLPLPCRKRVQRYNHFPNSQNFFSLFPELFSLHSLNQRVAGETFFSKIAENVPKHYAKNGKTTRFFQKSALLDTGKIKNRCNLLLHTCLIHFKRIHVLRSILTHNILHQTPNRPSADLSIGTTALGGRHARHTRAVQSRLDAACFPACFPSSCRVTMP